LSKIINLIIAVLLYLFSYSTLAPIIGILSANEMKNATQIAKRIRIFYPIIKPLLGYYKKIFHLKEKHTKN
jgi:hypothetical protein